MSASGSDTACCPLRWWCDDAGGVFSRPVGPRPDGGVRGPFPSEEYARRKCQGDSGSGDSGGGSDPGPLILCDECPDTSLPATVVGTVVGPIGGCTLPGPLTFTRSGAPGSYRWDSDTFPVGPGGSLGTFAIYFQCSGGNWRMSSLSTPTDCFLAGTELAYGTCDPLAMTYTMPACLFCGPAGAGQTVTVVVTE